MEPSMELRVSLPCPVVYGRQSPSGRFIVLRTHSPPRETETPFPPCPFRLFLMETSAAGPSPRVPLSLPAENAASAHIATSVGIHYQVP